MTPNGTAIRAIRIAQKMSLCELARRAGITKPHLSRLERQLAGASPRFVQAIAAALQVPPTAITHKETT